MPRTWPPSFSAAFGKSGGLIQRSRLTANGEFMTAVCNDYHADEIFARQVWGLGQPGDLLIAFTTSGKSRNILKALEEAKRRNLASICFPGT
jgi:phosphoheptose isomerase